MPYCYLRLLDLTAAVHIVGVQQMVRGVAAGFLQELFVQLLNLDVLVGTADLVVHIGLVHLFHALGNLGRILYQGCAAAIEAA